MDNIKIKNMTRSITSESISENDIEKLVGTFASVTSYIILHQVNAVYIGYCRDEKIILPGEARLQSEYLMHLRVFNEDAELYLWRLEGKIFYRISRDNLASSVEEDNNSLEKVFVYDEPRKLWGRVKAEEIGGWSLLKDENRGFNLAVPFVTEQFNGANKANKVKKDTNQNALMFQVRNYYTPDEDGMLRFKDARLLGFYDTNMKLLEVI